VCNINKFCNIFIYKSYLDNNKDLNTVMIKFGNTTLDYCNFNNINILCYEPTTCELIKYNNKYITDDESKNEFKICNKEEIDKSLNQNEDKSTSSFIINASIIVGSIVVILIGYFAISMIINKRRNNSNIITDNDTESFRNANNDIFIGNNNNNNHGSLDMQEAPPSYDENNIIIETGDNNETSAAEGEEPPPEYTEFNNLIKE